MLVLGLDNRGRTTKNAIVAFLVYAMDTQLKEFQPTQNGVS
jgi:hypothetical protein